MTYFSYLFATGLTTGAVYALIALGIVIVYRATNVVNFAHGELFMLAGFFAWSAHVTYGLSYLLALVVAVALTFVLSLVIYRLAFKPLMSSKDLNPILLVMVGLSFVLKGVAREFWGGKGDNLTFPPLVSPAPIQVGGVMVMSQQLVVLVAAVVVMAALFLLLRYTRAGKFMQATADNAKAARLVGLRVDRVYMYTFGVGGAVAAISAVLMAPLTLLNPDMGFALFIKGFAAAVLGGLTSLAGAVVGGLILGIAEQMSAGYIESGLQEVAAFIVILVVMIFAPNGLFGTRPSRAV
jgi:branched-chain amino acid transport system permease protein